MASTTSSKASKARKTVGKRTSEAADKPRANGTAKGPAPGMGQSIQIEAIGDRHYAPIDALRAHPDIVRIMPEPSEDERQALTANISDRVQAGAEDPFDYPIVILPDGVIIDGHTRWTVARALVKRPGYESLSRIPVIVRADLAHDVKAQIDSGVSINAARRQMNVAARKRLAKHILGLHPDWSNRRVSALAGLSPNTVQTVRDEIGADARRGRAAARKGKGKGKATPAPATPVHALRLFAKQPPRDMPEIRDPEAVIAQAGAWIEYLRRLAKAAADAKAADAKAKAK